MPDKIIYIVIVDDHTMFRRGLTSLINLFPGYKVLFDAANGKEMLTRLHPDRLPDIVLLDINMPEMDGYDTALWLRKNYPGVAVLALSTMDADLAVIKMIKCGAKGYLLKDADLPELKQAFKEVMENGFFYNDIVSTRMLRSLVHLVDDKSLLHNAISLSDKEMSFLKLCCSERTYQEIASEMFLSEKTIDGYRDTLFRKLQVNTRVGLVLYAIKNGIVNP
ncbi:MAG TPA: DNA-binding response regulator [Chitinophagaceae bacterium]|nr:DNA-binding response regulator [Chitinophagaceae bacterium]